MSFTKNMPHTAKGTFGTTIGAKQGRKKGVKLDRQEYIREAVWWTAKHIALDSPPKTKNPIALGLWQWAKINPDDFYKGLFIKFLPSKAQVDDRAESFKDDGRVEIALVGRLLAKSKGVV